MFIKSSWFQHLVGLTGQVSSALPLLLITIFLSRVVGLREAGLFTVMVGSSAVAYSFSLWGLRTAIVRDRMRKFSAWNYITVRLLAVAVASVITWYLGKLNNLDSLLLWVIIFYRICDTLIDLGLALDQVWLKDEKPLVGYSARHLMKLIILITAILIGYFSSQDNVYLIFLISGIFTLITLFAPLLISIWRKTGKATYTNLPKIFSILKYAWWFAFAAVTCAIITSLPRISIAWFYEGDIMGVIGVSLSVTTFFGMMYNTTWIRYFPKFSHSSELNHLAKTFIIENVIISIFLALGSWFILPYIVGIIFKFDDPVFFDLSQKILVSSTVFFLGQVVTNLFKLTVYPWLESIMYMAGILVPFSVVLLSSTIIEIPILLVVSGLTMFTLSLIMFFVIKSPIHKDYQIG